MAGKQSNRLLFKTLASMFIGIFTALLLIPLAHGDGTEELGVASVEVAQGSGIVVAGTGMANGSGTISLSVPDNSAIKQVLLYWSGEMRQSVVGDDSIIVNGTEIFGNLIGGPALFYGTDTNGAHVSAYRADITQLSLVGPGDNNLNVSGLTFDRVSDGAGVFVIYDEPGLESDIQIRDGVDLAYVGWPAPRMETIPQTYHFTPSWGSSRTATLSMFFGSAEGEASTGGENRPSSIQVTVGDSTQVFSNELQSGDGEEWDSITLEIGVAEGADSLTVQPFSRDDFDTGDSPASFSWVFAGLSISDNAGDENEGDRKKKKKKKKKRKKLGKKKDKKKAKKKNKKKREKKGDR